jgi:hypothetical protein
MAEASVNTSMLTFFFNQTIKIYMMVTPFAAKYHVRDHENALDQKKKDIFHYLLRLA